jgi:hypothetical protein
MKNKPLPSLSNCCNAEMLVSTADEGTAYYFCKKCGDSCAPASLPVKEGKSFFDLPESEKKEIIQKAAEESGKEMRKLMDGTPPVVSNTSYASSIPEHVHQCKICLSVMPSSPVSPDDTEWKPEELDSCTVVHIYKDGEALELEFIKDGKSHLLTVMSVASGDSKACGSVAC